MEKEICMCGMKLDLVCEWCERGGQHDHFIEWCPMCGTIVRDGEVYGTPKIARFAASAIFPNVDRI